MLSETSLRSHRCLGGLGGGEAGRRQSFPPHRLWAPHPEHLCHWGPPLPPAAVKGTLGWKWGGFPPGSALLSAQQPAARKTGSGFTIRLRRDRPSTPMPPGGGAACGGLPGGGGLRRGSHPLTGERLGQRTEMQGPTPELVCKSGTELGLCILTNTPNTLPPGARNHAEDRGWGIQAPSQPQPTETVPRAGLGAAPSQALSSHPSCHLSPQVRNPGPERGTRS